METTFKTNSKLKLSEKKVEMVIDIVCYAFIVLFIYTASSKLMDYTAFAKGLHNSVLLKSYSNILAWLIPGLEIGFSTLLLIPMTRLYGLILSLLIMVVFTAYLIYMISYGGPRTCGCGGVIQAMSWIQHIYFNIAFILMAILGIYMLKFKMPN